MECNFCKKKLSSISSLNNHKLTAKYCLLIQGASDNSKKFQCNYCCKILTSKQQLTKHLNICKNIKEKEKEKNTEDVKNLKNQNINFENELKNKNILIKLLEDKIEYQIEEKNKLKKDNLELKEEILKLKTELKTKDEIYKDEHECLKEIAKQPKHTSNTTNKIVNIQTPFDFNNIEFAKKIIDEKYNINYILDGQKGMADFAVENMLKDENGKFKYVCTDPSRNIFKFKDPSGEIRKDVDAKKLTNFLIDGGIKNKACNMAIEWWTNENGEVDGNKCDFLLEKAESIKTLKEDNTIFKRELISNISV